MVLNNYVMELKASNPGSSVLIISEKQRINEVPTFQKMYICLSSLREGFIAGCRRIIGIDGYFLKGHLLLVVGKHGHLLGRKLLKAGHGSYNNLN